MIILVVLLVVAAFFIGIFWTKFQQVEKANQADVVAKTKDASATVSLAPSRRSAREVDPVTDDDHVKGDRKARFALIEYSDLECPYCKRFHPTAQRAIDEYPGQLMWVYRHYPITQIHAKAKKEAEALECADKLSGNEAFWALTDKIFEVTPSNNGLDLETLPDLASQVGLDKEAFKACLDSGEMAAKVDEDYQSGVRAGVRGTPGNFLLDTKTGKSRSMPGAVPYPQLKQAIEDLLSKN